MTMDRHVDIADKLEAYALGQLPEQESREVDAHLQECSTCAQEARELAAVLAGIGESVPPVAPSADLAASGWGPRKLGQLWLLVVLACGVAAALGFLCGIQDSAGRQGASAAFGSDPHGRFLGAKLSLAFR